MVSPGSEWQWRAKTVGQPTLFISMKHHRNVVCIPLIYCYNYGIYSWEIKKLDSENLVVFETPVLFAGHIHLCSIYSLYSIATTTEFTLGR